MKTGQPETEPQVLELERIFKSRPRDIFDAFSSGDAMKRWFGPGSCGVLAAEIDFREGGKYRLLMNTEKDGEITLVGTYLSVDRPDFLSFSWRWEGNPAFNPCDSVVEISFGEHPAGTLLRLRQTGIEAEEDRSNHGYGWNGAFDKLEKLYP